MMQDITKNISKWATGWFFLAFLCTVLFTSISIVIMVLVIINFGRIKDIDEDVDCNICYKTSTNCSDNNPCTYDYMQFGACANPTKPNGAVCDDVCLTSSAGTCSAGTCTGTCLGNCVSNTDCPSIDGFVQTNNATCSTGGCIYTLNFFLPFAFNDTCTTDSQILKDICKIELSTTYTPCLQVDVNCDISGYFTCIISFACTQWAFIL